MITHTTPFLSAPTALAYAQDALASADQADEKIPPAPRGFADLRHLFATNQLAYAARHLKMAAERYADNSPELHEMRADVEEALARDVDFFAAHDDGWQRVQRGELTAASAPIPETRMGFIQRFFGGISKPNLPISIKMTRPWPFWGTQRIVITIPHGLLDRYPLKLIFAYLYETSGFGVSNLEIGFDYDLTTGVLRRLLHIRDDRKEDRKRNWIPGAHAMTETVIDDAATHITMKPVTLKPGQRNLLAEYLRFADDGDKTEVELHATARQSLTLPLSRHINAVRRILDMPDGRCLAVEVERFSNWVGHQSPRYAHSRNIHFGVVEGVADTSEILAFLGARLLGAQFGPDGRYNVAHLPGVDLVGFAHAALNGSLSLESTVPFTNAAVLRLHDELFLRVLNRDLHGDPQTPAILISELPPVQPKNRPTLLVREETLDTAAGELGSVIPEDQRHRRFHLLHNGEIPVSLTIEAGSTLKEWQVSLRVSPAHYNKMTRAILVSFLGDLMGVSFAVDDTEVIVIGPVMAPSKRFAATVPGLGRLSLDFYHHAFTPLPSADFHVEFIPGEDFHPQSAQDFLTELFARIRSL